MEKFPFTVQFDPATFEVWELISLESGKVFEMTYIFSRHLTDDASGQLVSPDLPNTFYELLTPEEKQKVRSCDAFKALSKLPVAQLRTTAADFLKRLQGNDPK